MGKFLSLEEISSAKHEQEIWNSMVNRGDIDTTKFVRTHYVVCGCGVKGCGFITTWKKNHHDDPKHRHAIVDLAEQNRLYQTWLKEHSGVKK